MSQRAACQLERFGFTNVHDFVHGKAYWLASGRTTTRTHPVDRVVDHLNTDIITIDADATATDALNIGPPTDHVVVVSGNDVVVGVVRTDRLQNAQPTAVMADIMTIGPTTIRPDEDAQAVRGRMAQHNVRSLLVTKPTGELLGTFDAK